MADDPAGEFPLDSDLIYLNHAAVAPWPRRTAEAVRAFAEENLHRGAAAYPRWVRIETRLRERLARLLHAPDPDDIALLKNTSEALSVVAHGLHWQRGDKVIISNEEFPSNRIVWESLRDQGVTVHAVDLHSAATPEQALIDAMDASARLLSISSVQYASGLRMDLETLGAACARKKILFCVDAIQSAGALRLDVQAIRADFVMADGHKWLLGPEGLAFFYARPAVRERLRLHQYGWHMVENHLDFDDLNWRVAHGARRFECGSPNMLGIHALDASLSLLLEFGMDAVERRVLANSGCLLEEIEAAENLQRLSSPDPARRSGIVLFRHHRLPPAEVHARLMEQGVICAARGAGVRFSPHFHTPAEQLREAVRRANALN